MRFACRYGFAAANYGGPVKLYEMEGASQLRDVSTSAGMTGTTGGRAIVAGMITSTMVCLCSLQCDEGHQ